MGYSEDRSNLQACLEAAHRIRSLRRRPPVWMNFVQEPILTSDVGKQCDN